ncbi:MAG: hypothetical protein IT500_12450 [Rubrivivax sp.]|nr:hypothetical protein [Rubrivivax sp.]
MGARELLHDLVCAGFSLEADGDKIVVRPASKLTDDLRADLRAVKPELLRLLASADRPYKLTLAQADAAHAEPWVDAAVGLFVASVGLFLRRGIDADDADDIAERLHLRDAQMDDRRLCLECTHLAGRAGAWRCGDHRAARVLRDVPGDLVARLQRCPGFRASHKEST